MLLIGIGKKIIPPYNMYNGTTQKTKCTGIQGYNIVWFWINTSSLACPKSAQVLVYNTGIYHFSLDGFSSDLFIDLSNSGVVKAL